jgi:hypothetical protein
MGLVADVASPTVNQTLQFACMETQITFFLIPQPGVIFKKSLPAQIGSFSEFDLDNIHGDVSSVLGPGNKDGHWC